MNEENIIQENDIENNIVDISFNNIVDNSSNKLSICDFDYEKQEEERYNTVIQDVCKSLDISKEQVSKTLDRYVKEDLGNYGKVNPIYHYVPFDFTVVEYWEEKLSAILNYTKKTDSKQTNKNNIMALYEYSNTWINKIVYYWIGLTNNLIHKRRYLEYSEKLAGLETRLKNIQKNFESQEIITDDLIKDFFSDLYDCYRSLDVFFEYFIKFMCNSRAPIGEFFRDYQFIKDNVFNKCSVMDNELFLKTVSHIEIKKYVDFIEPDKAIDFCKSNFPQEFEQLEDRLQSNIQEDKYYVEKEQFLFLLRKLLIDRTEYIHTGSSIVPLGTPNIFYGVSGYADRSEMLLTMITFLFILNKLYKKMLATTYLSEKKKYKEKIDNLVNNFRKENSKWFDKVKLEYREAEEILEYREAYYKETESTKKQLETILTEVKNVANSPEEDEYCAVDYQYKDVTKTFNKYISKLYCWKRYNIKIINDINEIIILFFSGGGRYYLSDNTEDILYTIKEYMIYFLDIENRFKDHIFEHYKDEIINFHPPTYFNEREIWWFYYVDRRNCSSKSTWDYNPIRDFAYYNNYIRYQKNIKRIPYPLSNDVYWDEIGMDIDKLEYSKRHHYFVNECLDIILSKNKFSFKVGDKIESNYKNTGKWNIATITNIDENEKYDIEYDDGEKETNIDIDSIRSLEEIKIINLMRAINQQKDDLKELEKKELLQNRIIKTNDVILQLKKMGEFMKEGVLINDQLFFKFILFTINFLIFLGQYFWNNHIEPEL
jgi:hypothetical protein